jgi:acetoin utilization protein AcuB
MKNTQISLFDLVHEIAASIEFELTAISLAADVMTRDIRFLTLDHTVSNFLEFMEKNKVRHVTIFDPPTEPGAKPFFIGIISERDVLRYTQPDIDKSTNAAKHQKGMKERLVQFVTRKPICVSPNTPVHELISIMIQNHIDMIPVLDSTEIVGIITTTDILKLLVTFDTAVHKLSKTLETTPSKDPNHAISLNAWTGCTAKNIMTASPLCLGLADTLEKAIELLKKNCFKHVPIIGKSNRLVGVVSDRDILRRLPYADTRHASKQKKFRDSLFSVPPNTLGMDAPLAHIMKWEPLCITENTSLAEISEKLRIKKISCLPVMNSDQNLCGMVTVTDLMRTILLPAHSFHPQAATPNRSRK